MKKSIYAFLTIVTAFLILGVVTTNAQIVVQTWDFESNNIGDSLSTIGWSATDASAVVADDPVASGNNVLEATINNYNAAPVLMFVLPSGKTLADYTSFSFKGYFAQGDVGWKDIVVEAYQTMPTGAFANDANVKIGSWNRASGGSTAWEDITIDITNTSALADTIYVAFGINCGGTGDIGGAGSITIWYADDVTLVGAAPSSPLVTNWGAFGRYGWPIVPTSEAGSAEMGSDTYPQGNWGTIRGEFAPITATETEAIVVTGKLEFIGGDLTSWGPLRYGLFNHDGAGTLHYANTDSARFGTWENEGTDSVAFVTDQNGKGYMFSPKGGTNTHTSGQGGQGTAWGINGGSWISTWSGGTMTLGAVENAPARADITAGVYDFAMSVQPQSDGTNEVRYYLVKEDNSYWVGGIAIDTTEQVTTFNGLSFGINSGNGIEETGVTGLKVSEVSIVLGSQIEIPEAPFSAFYVDAWGAFGRYGWEMTRDTNTIVGNAGMIGEGGPQGNWGTVRGEFVLPVKATEEKAIIVTGKLEFLGGDPDVWSPLRYGLFNHDGAGTLHYANTDSARFGAWENEDTDSAAFVTDQNGYGYMFSPKSGTAGHTSGQGGNGTAWGINGGGWISTWSDGTMTLGAVDNAPIRARMTAGVYDFAISVQPQLDGTNEVRYYLIKEDNSYWVGGIAIDTTEQVTTFNGVSFGVNNSEDMNGTDVNGLELTDVKVDLGNAIIIPEAPFSAFYVDQWGSLGGRTGWPILVDSNAIVGDASMGSSEGPPSSWATIRGGFGGDVNATEDKAIVVSGQIEFLGGDVDAWSPLRYGLFYHDSVGTLENQYSDSAAWSGKESDAYGYMFSPASGTNGHTSGNGGNATAWYVDGGNWISTWSGCNAMHLTDQAPARAVITAGLYDFAISVQPLGDGTNEVRYYIEKEDSSYWTGGISIDTVGVSTKFNGIVFGIINGMGDNGITLNQVNLIAVNVDRGDPIEIPDAPFSAFYIPDWGFIGGKTGGWELTPGEFIGNTTISGAAVATDWVAVQGGFTGKVGPTAEKALAVTGKIELVDGGFEDYSSLRFGLFYSDSAGTLDSTDIGFEWSGSDSYHSGYLFLPPSGTNGEPDWSGAGESGSWGAVVDASWISTNGANNYVLGNEVQRPAEAVGASGTYDFGIYVIAKDDGTSEIKYFIASDDESYLFKGEAIDNAVVAQEFNCVVFGLNSSTATAMNLIDVAVDRIVPTDIPVGVANGTQQNLPSAYALNQNYPNPFNPSTTIEFALPQKSNVKLVVYDILGSVVTELVDNEFTAGYHKVSFNAANLASGIYFYSLKAGDFVSVKKLMLLK